MIGDRGLVAAVALPGLFAPGVVLAQGRTVTVVNSGIETIRRIEVGTTDNRLRSSLPPGAQAQIGYSTGCTADVRIGYDGGRTETITGVDVCSNPRIASGQGVLSGTGGTGSPAPPPVAGSGPVTGVVVVGGSAPRPGSAPGKAGGSSLPAKEPPPAVPPWTGKSITKRFGGMD